MHVHHTAVGLPVLHATNALSPTTLPDASNHYSQLLTPLVLVKQCEADKTQTRRRKEEDDCVGGGGGGKGGGGGGGGGGVK